MNKEYQTGGSWLTCYRALMNWDYEPEAASAVLAAARSEGRHDDGAAEVTYFAQAGTFELVLKEGQR